MTAANPAMSLDAVSSAQDGSGMDLTGTTAGPLPTTMFLTATVTGWADTYNLQEVAAFPYANVGLEVSRDNSNFVRVANVLVNGDGQYKSVPVQAPARYARAVLDALHTRITALTLTAWVAGGS